MLKALKLVASVCCIAVFLTACQKDKEAPKVEPVAPVQTPAAEPAKPVENLAPAATTETAPATTPVSTEPAAQATQTASSTSGQTDPFTYCESVGTVDKTDATYTGEALPEKLIQAMVKAQMVTVDLPQLKEPGYVQWRCMDKKVYACIVGANIPCEAKADTSKEPNDGLLQFCKENATSDMIPAVASGRTTVYSWSCKDGKPIVGDQHTQVDAQGYPASFWTSITP